MRVVLVLPGHVPGNVVATVTTPPRIGEEIEFNGETWYVVNVRHALTSRRDENHAGAHGVFVVCHRERPA